MPRCRSSGPTTPGAAAPCTSRPAPRCASRSRSGAARCSRSSRPRWPPRWPSSVPELTSYTQRVVAALESSLAAVNQGDAFYTNLGLGLQRQDLDGAKRRPIEDWNDYKGGATDESG